MAKKDNSARKITSLNIDPELWKRLKKHCIDLGVPISEYLENLIKKELEKK